MYIANVTDDDDDMSQCDCIEKSPLTIIIISIIPCLLSLICEVSFLIFNIIKFFKKQMYISNCSDIV